MITFDRIELLHWDIQPHQVLPLAGGITLVTGENGSGKTSLLDAFKVGLGAVQLGVERTIDGYLLKQAQPLAMIRVLVDNRPYPGTRRRPFDPLGEQSRDLVTLAVVFRQEEERRYRREYFILDGDEVPLASAGSSGLRDDRRLRPLPSASDYRARLRKVGIGKQYLKLLCLPQGEIASFCRHPGDRLFDELYDIIGGRDALEAWEERLAELAERQREHGGVDRELRLRRSQLELLEQTVRRHHDYRRLADEVAVGRRAVPHVRLAQAREESARCELDVQRLRAEAQATEARMASSTDRRTGLQRELEALEGRRRALAGERRDAQGRYDDTVRTHARLEARVGELERLRAKAEGVAPLDPDALGAGLEERRAELARGQAAQREREAERAGLTAELEQVDRGLLPFPPEVDAFREVLRRAGVMHHVLAEVLDVSDPEWTDAIEGYLGRRRFAILVQDPERWGEAAELARAHRYSHGVLAPDVRGHSPADLEGLLPLVGVGEVRYRALLARLLRRVRPGEPPQPLVPPRGGVRHLASDGFLTSRLEARYAPAGRHYLGRDALERRRRELRAALGELDRGGAEWQAAERELRARIRADEAELGRQRDRLAWAAAQSEYAEVRAAAAEAAEGLATRRAELEALAEEDARLVAELGDRRQSLGDAGKALEEASQRFERLRAQLVEADGRAQAVASELGALLDDPPPPADAAVQELLAQALPPAAVERLAAEGERRLEVYEAAVRDPMLPVNFERQSADVAAVEGQLERLKHRLDQTKEAADEAHRQYRETTRRIFRAYFGRLREAAAALDWGIDGRLEPREDGRFECVTRVRIGDKPPVAHDSEDLSGGQKAALSILMGMTAVSLESEGAGFFLIDEPFSASDVHKMNELGRFLGQTGAQYLLSMPTSADLEQCGDWLEAVWLCTLTRGGVDEAGRVRLAPPVRLLLAPGARARQEQEVDP